MTENLDQPVSPRIAHFDALRGLAALAVVVIHAAAMVFLNPGVTVRDWWIADLYHAAAVWAVPVFVMLSGALLLEPAKPQTAGGFLKRRAARLLAPLVFWSVFYLALRVHRGDFGWAEGLINCLFGIPYVHLWYLYMIAGLYFLTPPLRSFLASASPREIKYALGLAFAGAVFYSMLNISLQLGRPLALISAVPFIGYYLAGHELKGMRPGKRPALLLAGAVVCSVIATAIGTGWIHRAWTQFPGWKILCDPHSPTVIATSVAIFILASRLADLQGMLGNISRALGRFIAPYSLGVYIIHPLFLMALDKKFGLNGLTFGAALGVPLCAALAFLLSLLAAFLIAQLPYARVIIGLPARGK